MKNRTIAEVLTVILFGFLSALLSIGQHLHWQRLGESVYLLHAAQIYQKSYSGPLHEASKIFFWVLFALLFFGIFKAVAQGFYQVLVLIRKENDRAERICPFTTAP